MSASTKIFRERFFAVTTKILIGTLIVGFGCRMTIDTFEKVERIQFTTLPTTDLTGNNIADCGFWIAD